MAGPSGYQCDAHLTSALPGRRLLLGEIRDLLGRENHDFAILRDGDRCVVSHALRAEGTLLAEALARFGLTGISARRLDARYRFGGAGDGWLRIPIAPAVRAQRPQLALIQRLPLEERD